MQLTLLTLLAYAALGSAQDSETERHAHHQRAPPTTLLPQVIKAESASDADSVLLTATATSIARTGTTPVEAQTEVTPAPTDDEEDSDETNDVDPSTAPSEANVFLNLKAKVKAKLKPKSKSKPKAKTKAKAKAKAKTTAKAKAKPKPKPKTTAKAKISGSGKGNSNPNPTHKTKLPPATASGKPYLSKAHVAIARMQTFYNGPRPGQWSEGWWNGANAYALLADLRSRDNSDFIKKITDGPNGVFARTVTQSNKSKYNGMAYDDWYDDMLWWCVGLIKAYDVTGNKLFLTTARATWKRVQVEARGATCGGLYNAMKGIKGRGQSAIATLLYVEVTALFAKRYPQERSMFLNLAKGQWKWVMNNIYQYDYIRGDGLVKGPGGQCIHNGAILSYLEGTAINAAVALNDVTGDYSYIDIANTIATKSLQDVGLNRSGILHDNCDVNMACNQDEAQFKGVFMRGLRNLYAVQPHAVGGQIPAFLRKNADSIWANTRNKNNLLGQNWAGPFNPTGNSALAFSQHSSATMALVAAAMV